MNWSNTTILFAILALPSLLVAQDDATDGHDANEQGAEKAENVEAKPNGLGLKPVPEAIRKHMQDREYGKAVAAIDQSIADKQGPVDYLYYLMGRALHLSEKYDDAIKTFDALVKRFPESPWARRARFAKGVSQARQGDFRAAELTYRAEADFLLSLDRKQEIADIYLEFADSYFKPPKEDQKPRYDKALEFYIKALEVGPQPKRRQEVELLVGRCYQLMGNHGEAIKRYQQFIQQYEDSKLQIEARYRLGESQLAAGQPVEARRTWQDLLSLHQESDSERLPDAAARLAKTYGFPSPGNDEDLSLGVAALRKFLKKYPDHKLAAKAQLQIAQGYLARGRHEDAVAALRAFIDNQRYQDAEELPQVRVLLGQSYLQQRKFDDAITAWREFLTKHPTHSSWSNVQRQIIDAEYAKAYAGYQDEQYAEAVKLLGEFNVKYPLDNRNRQILYLFGDIEMKQGKVEEAIESWQRLVSKYPGTQQASLAQFMVANTFETKLGEYEKALKEFKKLNWGSYASLAQQRAARLTNKSLSIATERVFRSNESPLLKLTSRNLETVSVKIYTVDMETYFRKMHLASGVESLDIALIDPDKTFEFKVPDYAEYRETTSEIPIELPTVAGVQGKATSGVVAVTVSSETMEATTMLVQSDLDVIVKSSRDEAFVFAQNMRTGKPWLGARVLISNGDKVFAEGVTGDDGVLHKSYEELKSAGDIRVFAIDGAHAASNVVGLSGVGVAQGLSRRGYIYTDRPAYRAGQLVNIRGVIRQVKDDIYTVEKDKEYTVEVFDNRDRLIAERSVKLSGFGSFFMRMLLPQEALQGRYRVSVQDKIKKEQYAGTFTVHEYRLEPVQIQIESERTVFYRGEQIEGKIKLSYYYGAPVANREIRYQLAGGRSYTEKTNADGEVAFSLPTREYRVAQPLRLDVSYPERSLSTANTFFLVTQGFRIKASTVRNVYLAGDTFEVDIITTDAEDEPVSRDLKLLVLRRTESGTTNLPQGNAQVQQRDPTENVLTGEVLVEEHELATDDEGVARKTLRLDDGGRYILRVVGTDRFGNEVATATNVQISDDDDATRLRILADKHTFKVGDETDVVVHWREAPTLALVTFQGAKILDYRLVQLQTGVNKIAIPMTANLAPNFDLAVSVMTDQQPEKGEKVKGGKKDAANTEDAGDKMPRRFHEASSPFTVQRQLNVSIALKAKGKDRAPRPGEDVEVVITTTDPQGKPVAAEVSLAMVQESLLNQFGSPITAIEQFFRGARRQSAMRTTSSITFSYQPGTRQINSRLLAERERIATAEEESRRLEAMLENGRVIDGEALGLFGADEALPTEEGNRMWSALDSVAESTVRNDLDPFGSDNRPERNDPLGYSFGGGGSVSGPGSGQPADARTRELLAGRRSREFEMAMNRSSESVSGQAVNHLFQSSDFTINLGGTHAAHRDKDFNKDQLNAYYFQSLSEANVNEVQVLTIDGTCMNLNFENAFAGDWNRKSAEKLAGELRDQGAVLLPQTASQETAYWNPAIITDDKGQATVTFTVPERSTSWRLLAKGVTQETLAGEATDDLTVKKELFGQIKLPTALTNGDEITVLATVHNTAIKQGKIDVTLTTTIGGKSVSQRRTVDLSKLDDEAKKQGIHELAFETEIDLAAAEGKTKPAAGGPGALAKFELKMEADQDGEQAAFQDVTRKAVPIWPYGEPVFAIAGGTATSDTTAFVQPPAGMKFESPRLEVIVGPTIEQSLLDVVYAPATWCQVEVSRLAIGGESTASDLMASLALQKLIGASRDAGSPQVEALDGRIRSAISALVSSQGQHGGWAWATNAAATNQQGNRFSTARTVWALQLAQQAGYRVPETTLAQGVNFLRSALAQARVNDYETKAILLHVLSVAGHGDFPLANQLYRNRQSLSSAGLVHLTLAFAAMDRDQTAAELLQMLSERNFAEGGSKRADTRNSLPWGHAEAELRGLFALALSEVRPGDVQLKQQVDWLMAHRTGHRWSPDKATGPVMLAVCDWYARTKFTGESYKLTVFVNNLKAKEIEIDEDAQTQSIAIPAEMIDLKALAKGAKQAIRFEITGRGRFTYQCVLGGFVPADKLASTTTDWRIHRYYTPAPLELDGKEIPRGFGVLTGSYSTFRNEMNELPVAKKGHVELDIDRYVSSRTPDEHLEYLVVSEPIPAGVAVIEKSIRGDFERFEISPGRITFYLGSRRHIGSIHYDVHGYLPGRYHTIPAIVRNAYAADQMAVAAPKKLNVLAFGKESGDKYRLTPQELYELGRRHFDRRQFGQSRKHLTELFAKWNLERKAYRETARMLLEIALVENDAADVVKYFEIVIEKYPEYEIPFDKLVKVGDAYHKLGEYERSYLVFRTTVEASFLKESQVAGFLQNQGEFLRSVDVMNGLLRQYPPESYVASATYALAQQVFAKAPQAASDPKLKEAKVTRVDLVRRSLGMLENFLTAYPDDPAADQASFSLVTGLLELDAYEQAIARCQKYVERYPKSKYLDSFWYVIGYSRFARGEHEDALEMCRKVAETKLKNPQTGQLEATKNKWQAIYILGQIYHSLGKAKEAIEEYQRVNERFPDARQAIEYFTHKEIALPEVTTVKPGENVEVELAFRNVAKVDTKVYRIDLMKFSLLKRNLANITKINLAGIRPYHEVTLELGDGKDYRDRDTKIKLPLKEEGAYLVVCRGDNLHASGLALVSPLVVDVQQDATSGRVRATVRDSLKDRYVSEVHVKVIGTANADFTSGETDLRGIFVADGIEGKTTVIAQADTGRYAFFRGEQYLGSRPKPNASPQPTAPAGSKPNSGEGKSSSKRDLLLNVFEGNERIQMEQQKALEDVYDNGIKGGVQNFTW